MERLKVNIIRVFKYLFITWSVKFSDSARSFKNKNANYIFFKVNNQGNECPPPPSKPVQLANFNVIFATESGK